MSVAGFILILYSISNFNSSISFPGVASLLPCGGAALLIYAGGSRNTVLGKLLSLRPLVLMGLMSYSLYLWHWPILAFANYWALEPLSLLVRIGLIALTFVLAGISWKLVEQPFRKRRWLPTKSGMFKFAGAVGILLTALGFLLDRFGNSWPRMPTPVIKYANGRFDYDRFLNSDCTLADARQGKFKAIGSKRSGDALGLFVWGDSHAMAALAVVDELCREHSVDACAATYSATPPLVEYVPDGVYSLKNDGPAFSEAVLHFISDHRIRNVLLIARWRTYDAGRSELFHLALLKTIQRLCAAGCAIWIMQEVPNFPWDVPKGAGQHLPIPW